MPSQKPEKPANELTTEEAIQRLFPKDVIAHAKERADESDRVLPQTKRVSKSMSKE